MTHREHPSVAIIMLAIACLCAAAAASAQLVQASPDSGASGWRTASIAEYRAHLESLRDLTAACAKTRTREACDPNRVGPDDEVPWGAPGHEQKRVVRFAWLRVLLGRAQEPDEAAKARGADAKPAESGESQETASTSQLLEDAQDRLTQDLAQADAGAVGQAQHAKERALLAQVLTSREFHNLKQADQGPSAMERFNDWLNKLFGWLGSKQLHAAWIGRTLFWGFLALVGVGLAWALLQMERRWRIKLVRENDLPAPTAASARDWQLWLKDARESAARAAWREAIHFLYWSAISRLESKKLWPADRARTPREYLALVAAEDPRKSELGALTREFEWTWYGGRPAAEADYQRVTDLATSLFENPGSRP